MLESLATMRPSSLKRPLWSWGVGAAIVGGVLLVSILSRSVADPRAEGSYTAICTVAEDLVQSARYKLSEAAQDKDPLTRLQHSVQSQVLALTAQELATMNVTPCLPQRSLSRIVAETRRQRRSVSAEVAAAMVNPKQAGGEKRDTLRNPKSLATSAPDKGVKRSGKR